MTNRKSPEPIGLFFSLRYIGIEGGETDMDDIGKLLPHHGYKLELNQEFTRSHLQALMQLYQPLLNVHAVSLYMTFISQYETNPDQRLPYTHHYLMQFLNVPLPEIYRARKKLEAIGLIETFQLDNDNETIFTYQLLTPCTPVQFFGDGMLSQLLHHQLGKEKTNELYQLLVRETNQSFVGTNITASFRSVFQELPLSTDKVVETIQSEENAGPKLAELEIDITELNQLLSQRMLPTEKILTKENIKLMNQMAVLYNLTTMDIEKAVMWALSDQNVLNQQEFKAACMDLYQQLVPKKTTPTTIVDQKDRLQATENQPVNKQDQFIQMLEEISPRQLLEDLSNGNQASQQDLKMIADVMTEQGLTPGVMNVLIHYVMLKTDMKLTKSYLEKIASHWARKNVKTVRQAMTLAKSEHNKYQQWSTPKKSYYKKSTKKEVVPEWFKKQKQEQINQTHNPQEQSANQTVNVSELLKNYNRKKFQS